VVIAVIKQSNIFKEVSVLYIMERLHEYGKWAFLGGVLITLLTGIASFPTAIGGVSLMTLLLLLGLLVGWLNVSRENSVTFLLAVLVLMAAATSATNVLDAVSRLGPVHGYLTAILPNFVAFVGAAGFVVAVRAILNTNEGLGLLKLRRK
jgi:quinol-cytochrome oxidoreductase complex cytochrome b subunit